MFEDWQEELIKELKDPEFAKSYGAEHAKSGFGLTLLHYRQNQKITQKQIAEKLGFSQSYIAQIENGEVNLTLEAAGRILAVLGLKMRINTEPLSPQPTLYSLPKKAISGKTVSRVSDPKT